MKTRSIICSHKRRHLLYQLFFVSLYPFTCVGGGVNAGVAAVGAEDDFDGISCSNRFICFCCWRTRFNFVDSIKIKIFKVCQCPSVQIVSYNILDTYLWRFLSLLLILKTSMIHLHLQILHLFDAYSIHHQDPTTIVFPIVIPVISAQPFNKIVLTRCFPNKLDRLKFLKKITKFYHIFLLVAGRWRWCRQRNSFVWWDQLLERSQLGKCWSQSCCWCCWLLRNS